MGVKDALTNRTIIQFLNVDLFLMYLDQLPCHRKLWTGPLRMLGRSSTHHLPEPRRLSEYLCRKSLEPRVLSLSLLQETMIRESYIKTGQFYNLSSNYTAMIKHKSPSEGYPASVIVLGRIPVETTLKMSIVLVNYRLMSLGNWFKFLHLLVNRALDEQDIHKIFTLTTPHSNRYQGI